MISGIAYETVAWYLGLNGWSIILPMLERHMKNNKIIGLGFFRRDGSFYQIKLEKYA
jgi:hypothetical protein